MTRAEAIKRLEAYVESDCYTNEMQTACCMAIDALRSQAETGALKTTWETPESCPYCMEHLAMD